jgi:hypothetical protein
MSYLSIVTKKIHFFFVNFNQTKKLDEYKKIKNKLIVKIKHVSVLFRKIYVPNHVL